MRILHRLFARHEFGLGPAMKSDCERRLRNMSRCKPRKMFEPVYRPLRHTDKRSSNSERSRRSRAIP